MFQVVVLYHHPQDAAAFDTYYDENHTPIAAKIPGVLRYTVTRPGPDAEGNKPAHHMVATLEFADVAAFGAGMGSPEGQAAVADLGNFATGGVTMLTGDTTQVI